MVGGGRWEWDKVGMVDVRWCVGDGGGGNRVERL